MRQLLFFSVLLKLQYRFFVICSIISIATGTLINFAYHLCHFFVLSSRLTPIYMIMIGIYATLFNHMIFGPARPPTDTSCDRKWWMNLLYINNFVDKSEDLVSLCFFKYSTSPWGHLNDYMFNYHYKI